MDFEQEDDTIIDDTAMDEGDTLYGMDA